MHCLNFYFSPSLFPLSLSLSSPEGPPSFSIATIHSSRLVSTPWIHLPQSLFFHSSMSHSPPHSPHEICFILESVTELEGKGEVFLRVGRQQEEIENEWVRVLSPSFPLYEPLGCYYLLSLEEGSIVQELELRIDLPDKSYGASVRLKGEVKTRGRVQLYNEIDPSDVILITVAVLIRILPLTPREYQEATTQTPATKRINRLVQTEMERRNVSIATSPIQEEKTECEKMEKDDEEERRREVAEIVEKTIARRLMIDDLPSIDSRSKSLNEEVIEMRRSLRILGKEERNRRDKGDPPKESTAAPLTPPASPSTPSTSSSSASTSSTSTSSKSDSKSSSSASSSTESSSSSSSTTSSSQESVQPNMSPTTAYITNLREKIIAERKDSLIS